MKNVSFTSNIKFVPIKAFDEILEKASCSPKNNIRHIEPTYVYKEAFWKTKDNIFTTEIRTCTGGGIINNEETLMFHLIDESDTYYNAKIFESEADSLIPNPSNGLLVGGKYIKYDRDTDMSLPVFDKIKEFLSKKVNLSFFRNHKHLDSQTDLLYLRGEDSWYLCTKDAPEIAKLREKEPLCYVTDAESLKRAYENIHISKNDRLFINDKEITKEEMPDFFD